MEHRAVAHPEHSHAEEEKGDDNGERWQRADCGETAADPSEKSQQQPISTNAIGEPSSDGTKEAARDNDDRREIAGADFR